MGVMPQRWSCTQRLMRQIVLPMPGSPTIIMCGLLRMEAVHDTSSPLLLSPIRIVAVEGEVAGKDGQAVEVGCGFDSDAGGDKRGGKEGASTTGIGATVEVACC